MWAFTTGKKAREALVMVCNGLANITTLRIKAWNPLVKMNPSGSFMSSVNPVQTCFPSCLFTKWLRSSKGKHLKVTFQQNTFKKILAFFSHRKRKRIIFWHWEEEALSWRQGCRMPSHIEYYVCIFIEHSLDSAPTEDVNCVRKISGLLASEGGWNTFSASHYLEVTWLMAHED